MLKRIARSEGGAAVVNYLGGLVFVGLLPPGALGVWLLRESSPAVLVGFGVVWLLGSWLLSSSFRTAAQWQRVVVFRLGKLHSVRGPGWFCVVPFVDQTREIDVRVRSLDVPSQQFITRDNVPIQINGVLFFEVTDPAKAVTSVQEYAYAISLYAQTSIRDVTGQMSLDQVLAEQDVIARRVQAAVAQDVEVWGLKVTSIRLLEIQVPEELKKMMAREASAEREKRATITKAEGDRDAAVNLAAAAKTMAASPGAMQLRTLQTIDGLGPQASNTVVLAVPINILEATDQLTGYLKAGQKKLELNPPA